MKHDYYEKHIIANCIQCGIEYRPEEGGLEHFVGLCFVCRKKLHLEKYKDVRAYMAMLNYIKNRVEHRRAALRTYHAYKNSLNGIKRTHRSIAWQVERGLRPVSDLVKARPAVVKTFQKTMKRKKRIKMMVKKKKHDKLNYWRALLGLPSEEAIAEIFKKKATQTQEYRRS